MAKKISVDMLDGTKAEARVNEGGELELFCPCGMTLPMMQMMPMGVPMLCPCGRQYEPEETEEPGIPLIIKEIGK